MKYFLAVTTVPAVIEYLWYRRARRQRRRDLLQRCIEEAYASDMKRVRELIESAHRTPPPLPEGEMGWRPSDAWPL
jgi:hypothetical protein